MTDMNRRMLLRAAAGVIGAAVVLDPSVAWAMHPRFDQVLKLDRQGRVLVAGPTSWNAGEQRALISSIIVQGQRSAIGHVVEVFAPAPSWHSLTTSWLKPGSAVAYGWAVVFDDDGGADQYPWEVDVTLAA